MFSHSFYKCVHLIGIFAMLLSLGGLAFHMLQGGTKQNFLSRKKIGALHGIGLTLAFIAGFGLMARGHFKLSHDMWLWGKLAIWLILGASPAFFYKMPKKANALLAGVGLCLFTAVFLAIYKPFS